MSVLKTFFAVSTLAVTAESVMPHMQFTSGNIVVGAGYSNDMQQMAPQVCYNATVSSTSEQQAYIQLDTALSYSDLENRLGISVSIGGKFRIFSAEATARYLRSMRDQDYSSSLNYFQYATNKVGVQLAGSGIQALTESGKTFYNNGTNPYFGLECGDNYVSYYQQGALLVMGLNIKFSSAMAKTEFYEKAGVSFGNIVNAAESVKKVITNSGITGSVLIQAFQTGGDPSQLAKILNKDGQGQYYALTCSLTAMENCVKTASGLLDYAKDEFSTQFSFKNNTGLTPLGISFSGYTPIEYIGLTPPPSLVTQEVMQYRNELSSKLTENKYYQQKLYSLVNNGYPVKLDDAFINNVNAILSKANSNVLNIMQAHEGAADCFNFPNKCNSIKAAIDSKLQNITESDLKFLENIKYVISISATVNREFYNTGQESGNSWALVPKPNSVINITLNSVDITDEQYSYDFFGYNNRHNFNYAAKFNGHFDNGAKYEGTACTRPIDGSWNHCFGLYENKYTSPFFFEAFSKSDTENDNVKSNFMFSPLDSIGNNTVLTSDEYGTQILIVF